MALLSIRTANSLKAALTPSQRARLKTWNADIVAPALLGPPGDSDLRGQALNGTNDQLKDQKVVEIETTQAIAEKLLGWAKLLGFFVGVPLALLGIVLGFLGVKSYKDFSGLVKNAHEDVSRSLKEAQERAVTIKSEADTLTAGFAQLKSQLASTGQLAEEVQILAEKVDRIEEKVGFTSSSELAPEVRKQLESAFYEFQSYLQKVGFRPTGGKVDIHVPKKMTTESLAYYDPDKRRMVIDRRYASDPDLLYREYMHHVLSPSTFAGDADAFWAYYAIESGLATYFACSFTGNPRSAEKTAALMKQEGLFIWDLRNERKFSAIKHSVMSAMSDGTEVWGGVFWEIRQLLGQVKADRLLFKAWFALRPEDARKDKGAGFVKKVLELDETEDRGIHRDQIRSVFEKRGWKDRPETEGQRDA